MRSRTGCLTCRTRKLKCDEQKPQCSQCRKGNRECRPSEGIVFRHQQNASMNNGSTAIGTGVEDASDTAHDENRRDGRGGSLKGFYSYKNTFNEDNVWLDIPKQVVFVDNSDPYTEDVDAGISEMRPATASAQEHHTWEGPAQGPEPAVSMQAENHGLEAFSAVATHDRLSFYPASGPEQDNVSSAAATAAAAVAAAGNDALLAGGDFDLSGAPSAVPVSSANNNIRILLNPSHRHTPPVDLSTNATISPGTRMLTSARTSTGKYDADIPVETEYETAFLLRHFSEAPGLWMDLFDLRTYFASHVPLRAVRNPLLKNAACAYAAKQLGRVKGAKAPVGGVCSHPSVMETWPASDKVDWYWHGAKYYEKAIQLLMKELQPSVESFSSLSATDGLHEGDVESENPRKRRRTHLNGQLSGRARSDDVLAATAILSLYEFHDATDPAWSRHLSGVKSLLDVTEAGIQPLEPRLGAGATLHSRREPALSRARKATFWNFARQDYLAAFINKTQTRLDTDDHTLWTDAGVQLDDRGFVRPSTTDSAGHSREVDTMEEDVISNALIYVSSKIVNFINAVDTVATVDGADHAGLGRPAAPKQPLLERWHRLEAELNAWYDGLPDSFQPCARIDPNLSGQNPANNDASPFSEIWYSIPMCGSCMQHYHMARILLLLHKPGQSITRRSAATGLVKYPISVASEIRQHCYEICGISMSRPSGAVRIHSLQPLFVSGQHLPETRERRAVVQLMRSIEADLGWATEYRVKQLFEDWGWADDPHLGPPVDEGRERLV